MPSKKLRTSQTLGNSWQRSDQDVARVKKKHLIQSALLWFRDRTPEQAVDRFCELRAVDTLVVASNGSKSWTDKIKVTTADYCVNYVAGVDIIVWRDPNPPKKNTQLPVWGDFSVGLPEANPFPIITEHDLRSRRNSTATNSTPKPPSTSRRHSIDNGDMMRPTTTRPQLPLSAEKTNTPMSRERTLDKKQKKKTQPPQPQQPRQKQSTIDNTDDPENPTAKYQNSQETDFIQGDLFCDSF